MVYLVPVVPYTLHHRNAPHGVYDVYLVPGIRIQGRTATYLLAARPARLVQVHLSVVFTTPTLSTRAHSESDVTTRTTLGLRRAHRARQSLSVGRTSTLVGSACAPCTQLDKLMFYKLDMIPYVQRVTKEGCTLTGREVGSGASSSSLSTLITKARRCARRRCCAGAPDFAVSLQLWLVLCVL